MLFGVAALHSRAAHRFLMRSCLAESFGMMVGLTLLCTLGTDVCASMERVILLLLESPAPLELVSCWVFAPSELVVCGG